MSVIHVTSCVFAKPLTIIPDILSGRQHLSDCQTSEQVKDAYVRIKRNLL